jgi:copper chaperone CopZ
VVGLGAATEVQSPPTRLTSVDLTSERPAAGLRELTLDLCACARNAGPGLVTAALLGCPGVEQVHVDPYVTWALATIDPAQVSPTSIVEHMAAAGYEVRLGRLFEPESPAESWESRGSRAPGSPGPSPAPGEELC